MLRGVIHQYTFYITLILGPVMIWQTQRSEQRLGSIIYALSVCLLFGTSTLYHRLNWSPEKRLWMRRLDHTMIFVLIAGTFTPLVSTGIDPEMGTFVLKVVWGSVVVGAIIKLGWPSAPKWISGITYCALGWFAVVPLPDILEHWGWTCVVWLLIGGLLYTVGAVCYALKRPNLIPGIFGYHEMFHSFVSLAALCHYCSIAAVSW